jgi:energy-coupling factor transport system ATP-binding protein
MMREVIKVKDLYFTYPQNPDPVLTNVSLSIKENTFTTIIGENGSGKSTLAKLLIGINKLSSGQIKVYDQVLNEQNLADIRSSVGMVFQNPDNQFVGATVNDDVAFGLENHVVPHEEMDQRISESLAMVGMQNYRDRSPEMLSGGQKQRVAIASALAYHPKILILDEAGSMLDPIGRSDLLDLILRLKKQQAMTIISITHNLNEAIVSDYVYLLTDGQIKGEGKPAEIFENRRLIEDNHLELPFEPELIFRLKQAGFAFPNHWLNEEELVNYLWTLNLKI